MVLLKNSLSQFLFTIVLVTFSCQTTTISNPENNSIIMSTTIPDHVNKIVQQLKSSSFDTENFIDNCMWRVSELRQDKSKDSKMLLDNYRAALKQLHHTFQEQSYTLYSWKEAEEKNSSATKNLLEADIPKEDVFVVFVKNTPKHYFKMHGNLLQSLTPMFNENTIIGWV